MLAEAIRTKNMAASAAMFYVKRAELGMGILTGILGKSEGKNEDCGFFVRNDKSYLALVRTLT